MGRSKYSNILTIVLIIAIIAIIVISTIIATKIYKSHKAEKERKQAIAEFTTNIDNTNSLESNEQTNDVVNENIIINLIADNSIINQNITNNTTTTKPKKVKFYANTEFVMIGYIEIPKTGINYPILTDTSAEALDTSVGVLYPTNPELNKPGNVVIIGHNYRNGKFFSNNKKLSVGDKINITDDTGKKLSYTIYEIFETTGEDTTYMTRETGENIEISLSTCTDDGNKRLIILAKV